MGLVMNVIQTTHWMYIQYLAMWPGPCCTLRQAGKLILGPNPATKTRGWPLIGHSPGLLLDLLQDITP
jgi:hypothetical protein